MLTAEIIVHNENGLHTRPASKLVKLAKQFDSKIEILANDKKATATSMLQLMKLGIVKGNTITLNVHGEQPQTAFNEVHEFLTSFRD